MEVLSEYKTVFTIAHLLGVVIGFGAAIVADFLFFRFVRNFKLSNGEIYVMGLVSSLVWAGLFLIILSGILLFLTNPVAYSESSKFLVKMMIVAVITVNGSFLHFYIKPRLKNIDWLSRADDERRRTRKLAFAAGGISFNSWFLAMVLGALKSIPLSFGMAALIYVAFIACVVAGSQMIEWLYSRYLCKS